MPEGDDWLHEIKFDGYRLIAFIKDKQVQLLTRNGNDWSDKFPFLVQELRRFPISKAILDGELIALDKKGISNFQILQNIISDLENLNDKQLAKIPVLYTVFDAPYCKDFDLSSVPLIERKNILKAIFHDWKILHPHIELTNYIIGHGKTTFKEACQYHLEGIISKQISSAYVQKRSYSWLKHKCHLGQEFVIAGMTKPKGTRQFFGALLLGYYDNKGHLNYCGKVGTGFGEQSLKEIYNKLIKLKQKINPFYNLEHSYKLKSVVWLKPKLVCELKFTSWTNDGILRHPSFLGLRLEKDAKEVRREDRAGRR